MYCPWQTALNVKSLAFGALRKRFLADLPIGKGQSEPAPLAALGGMAVLPQAAGPSPVILRQWNPNAITRCMRGQFLLLALNCLLENFLGHFQFLTLRRPVSNHRLFTFTTPMTEHTACHFHIATSWNSHKQFPEIATRKKKRSSAFFLSITYLKWELKFWEALTS